MLYKFKCFLVAVAVKWLMSGRMQCGYTVDCMSRSHWAAVRRAPTSGPAVTSGPAPLRGEDRPPPCSEESRFHETGSSFMAHWRSIISPLKQIKVIILNGAWWWWSQVSQLPLFAEAGGSQRYWLAGSCHMSPFIRGRTETQTQMCDKRFYSKTSLFYLKKKKKIVRRTKTHL